MSDAAARKWVAEGACLCGRHRLKSAVKPFQVSYCHCRGCRNATGAPVIVFAGFKDYDVKFIGSRPDAYPSSPSVQRLFCSRCGTPIGYRDEKLANESTF